MVNKAFVSQVKVNCNETVSHTFHGNDGLAVRVRANVMQLSNQNGVSLSCDLLHKVCSFTLDGWLHGWYCTYITFNIRITLNPLHIKSS